MSKRVELNSENFDKSVLDVEGLSVVTFSATWCGPCKMLSPIMDKVANEHIEINIGKVDVDTGGDIATKLGIRSVPTTVFFKNGVEVNRIAGAKSFGEIDSLVKEYK